jgi:aspartate kinase
MSFDIVIQKYGGSSLSNVSRIGHVARRIAAKVRDGFHIICVVSAMGKTTDQLLSLSREIDDQASPREIDMLLTTGEQVSASLLSMALQKENISSKSLNAFQAGIITTEDFNNARITKMESDRLKEWSKQFEVIVITGFQGITEEGDLTTLGRGGSDTSAVALAASLGVPCEIFSDVDGIYSIDPRRYPQAKKRKAISYNEMLELTSHGAKVLSSRSVEIAKKYGVRIYCGSSFSDKMGSFVVSEEEIMEQPVVTGLTVLNNQSQVIITNLPNQEMVVSEIFASVAMEQINIDMISLIPLGEKISLSFTFSSEKQNQVTKMTKKWLTLYPGATFDISNGFDKVSVVGIGMQFQSGVASRFFSVLQGIPVKLVTTSEIKISILILPSFSAKVIQVLAQEFDL